MRRTRSLLVLLALFALAAGCGRDQTADAPSIPYFDLVAQADSAQAGRQTSRIDFGRPEAVTHLESGWSSPEVDRRRDRPFVWSDGEESVLRIEILEASDLEVRFTARPFAHDAERPQAIDVLANGEPAGQVELRRGVHDYSLTLPGGALRVGENRLTFRYRHLRQPVGEGTGEKRRLGVAWYALELAGGSGQRAEPQVSPERRSLFLPYGSQLAYLVRLEPDTEMRFGRLAFRGSSGRLDIWLETDQEDPRRVARLETGGEASAVEIPVEEPIPARLVLRARAEGSAGAEAGVLLEQAALWSRDPARQAAAWRGPSGASGKWPHIILYLVDTLRTDRLGVYGYDRPISPRLDEFAQEAVVFERAVGQSSWTRASIASLFTGLWPHTHGAIGRRDRLSTDAVTLAEVLQEGGYHTVAFATNPNIDERFGFSQGFDRYFHVRRGTDSPRVTARVLQWLDQWEDDGRPLFLYVHTVDPHDPYTPPPEYVEKFAPDSQEFLVEKVARYRRRERWEPTEENLHHLNQLYDAEVAFNDASFGVFLDELRQRGLYDDSILAFVSDHGEEFHEHGNFTHGKNLFGETLDFPFVLRFPGQREGRRVQMPVQHTDLMPTLLDYVGLPIPDAVEGRSLAAVADPGFEVPAGTGARIYSHLDLDGSLTLSLVDGDWKLIDWRGKKRSHKILFNRRLDPGETEDLAEEHPIRTAVMAAMIEERLVGQANRLEREEAELDEELERSLKALGYLQ